MIPQLGNRMDRMPDSAGPAPAPPGGGKVGGKMPLDGRNGLNSSFGIHDALNRAMDSRFLPAFVGMTGNDGLSRSPLLV